MTADKRIACVIGLLVLIAVGRRSAPVFGRIDSIMWRAMRSFHAKMIGVVWDRMNLVVREA